MPLKRITKLTGAFPRSPYLDSVRDDLNRLKLLWILSTTSPLLYLAISRYIKLTFFTATEMGFAPLPVDKFQMMVIAFALMAAGVQIAHVVMRHRFSSGLQDGRNLTVLLRVYRNRTLSLMAISEIPVVLGFILFIVQGHLWSIFLFGVASLFYYAQSYPSETLLGTYAKTKSR